MFELKAFKNSALALLEQIKTSTITPRQVCDFYLSRTKKINSSINALIDFDPNWVEQQLVQLESRLARGEKPGLAGLPVIVKDNICTKGVQTTCASRILKGFKPVYDATVIERLQKLGVIFLGKANCDEFAMGSSNEHSAYGVVRNPWDLERVPGGSSGGSAAVLAADFAPLSLGSDTGGSVRQPASLCGVYGLKPTYGRVSRYGLIAYGSSLDQIGPFARDIFDLALLYDAIAGYDDKDSTSLHLDKPSVLNTLKNSDPKKVLAGKKIGIIKELFDEGLHEDVRKSLEKAIDELRNLGAKTVDISLKNIRYSTSAYYVLATAEASSNLARFDGMRYGYRAQASSEHLVDLYEQTRSEGFGREVIQRIMLGTFALSSGYYDAYYGMALKARALISQDFREAFSQVDLLVSPVSPTTAFRIGEKSNDPLAMYLSDVCTIGVNLAGVPAMSIPAGFDQRGLPVGMQLIANWNNELELFKGAFAYEHATNWWQQKTPTLN